MGQRKQSTGDFTEIQGWPLPECLWAAYRAPPGVLPGIRQFSGHLHRDIPRKLPGQQLLLLMQTGDMGNISCWRPSDIRKKISMVTPHGMPKYSLP